VANVIDTVNSQHSQSISDRQKKNATFTSKTDALIKSLVEIIKQKYEIKLYSPEIGEIEVEIAENKVHNYCFVSKLKVDVINSDYFMQHIKSVLRANAKLDFCTITEDGLKEMLLQYNSSIPVLDFFKAELSRSFEEDLKPRKTIVLANSDKREEFSAGLNAKIYFDLLSYENNSDGIYIIDQPEDNVSQPSIKNYLIDCFNTMAENRQVIMVSHNPQFIVNLDVDNLIYISRKSDGEITVQSGALEYECDDYSVLKLVEENIDGGLDSIQKRWKRYEKANRT
ncbi:MAG: hypothetical protein IKL09_01170, partial [Clostridia bacterium]|nr:hypothetical protein [Clostridia bacterium]